MTAGAPDQAELSEMNPPVTMVADGGEIAAERDRQTGVKGNSVGKPSWFHVRPGAQRAHR